MPITQKACIKVQNAIKSGQNAILSGLLFGSFAIK